MKGEHVWTFQLFGERIHRLSVSVQKEMSCYINIKFELFTVLKMESVYQNCSSLRTRWERLFFRLFFGFSVWLFWRWHSKKKNVIDSLESSVTTEQVWMKVKHTTRLDHFDNIVTDKKKSKRSNEKKTANDVEEFNRWIIIEWRQTAHKDPTCNRVVETTMLVKLLKYDLRQPAKAKLRFKEFVSWKIKRVLPSCNGSKTWIFPKMEARSSSVKSFSLATGLK